MLKKIFTFVSMAILIIMAACTPGSPGIGEPMPTTPGETTSVPFPVETPQSEGVSTPTPLPSPAQPGDLPESSSEILAVLSERMGVGVESLMVLSFEQVQWPDGCLGAAQPDEMCTQAIVDGYRIILQAEGQTREFHTNLDGTLVREVAVAGPKGQDLITGAVRLARQHLARELGVGLEEVRLQSAIAVDWPDSCLGVARPEQACAQVITPGYQMFFTVNEKRYEVRTNKSGSVVIMVQQSEATSDGSVLITWHREGGIAGFCDDLVIYSGGWAAASNCRSNSTGAPVNYYLDEAQLKKIVAWVEKYSFFELKSADPAVADAMVVKLTFHGEGKEVAQAAQQEEILQFSQGLYLQALK